MAQVLEVSYSIGHTHSKEGSFKSTRFDIGEKVGLAEGDDPEVEFEKMRRRCLTRLHNDISKLGA
ncbi:MAG: hypothetical protein LPL29_07625 [Alphaproteobacteria bacterium]|nr:hypothetical protein [Alphaproteobacteria bacterium]